MRRTILVLFTAAVAAAVLAVGDPVRAAAPDPRMRAFGSCDQLLAHFKRVALAELPERGRGSAPGAPPPEPASESDQANGGFSQTNVQEAGVDEPDIVKSNGSHLFALAGNRLRAVAVRGRPRLVGTLRLSGGGGEMLLYGRRLLVMSGGPYVINDLAAAPRALSPEPPGSSRARVTEVDVGNPAAMRVVRTLEVDGSYEDARLDGATARLVFSFHGGPSLPRGPAASEPVPDDPAHERRAIEASRLSDWMPGYTLRRGRGRRSGSLVPCTEVLRSLGGDETSITSLLTVSMQRGLPAVDGDALLAPSPEVVYASRSALYLAGYAPGAGGTATAIHKLDARRRLTTTYAAGGRLAGELLNQFSLSEHRGVLRVATTEQSSGPRDRSESFVSVLRQGAGRLNRIGRVGNLGRGEQVQGVRFMGGLGYVVTFRRVDPLYTIDLRSPSRPRVTGELKILGYSAYLHPVGPGLLLGVGVDATAQGERLGAQVSLFDVSNVSSPRRLDQQRLGFGSSTEVEFDHHAFLYWPRTRLAVVPVSFQRPNGSSPTFEGVIGMRTGRSLGVSEVGRIKHAQGSCSGPIRRSFVAGDRLLTVSECGVGSAALATLAPRGFARFPGPSG